MNAFENVTFQSYQGNTYKSAVGKGDTMVLISMSQNNTPLQVYDIKAMDCNHISKNDQEKTDIERALEYVGEGNW